MKGKNYSYSDAKGSYGIEVNITPHMLHQIKEIDKQYLVGILKDQEFSREHPSSWIGKCPFCSSTKKRNSQVSYQPAYLNPNNMGYVFHCCSCMASTTAYKLLLAVRGLLCSRRVFGVSLGGRGAGWWRFQLSTTSACS